MMRRRLVPMLWDDYQEAAITVTISVPAYPGETIARRVGPGMTRATRVGPGETTVRRVGPGMTRARRSSSNAI